MTDRQSSPAAIVAGSGAVAVDQLIYVDREFAAGKGRVLRTQMAHGGNVATALAAVATLGGGSKFVGYLPDRSKWANVYEDLSTYGVDLSSASSSGEAPICSTILIAPNGDRFIAFDDHTPLGPDPESGNLVLDGVGALLLDAYAANPPGLELMESAHRLGIPTIADIERAHTLATRQMVERVQHLVVPLDFAKSAAGADSPESALANLWNENRTAVVVTDGERGAWFRAGDSSGHVPAFMVAVVDTNGCGDVFHGVYALRIAQGLPIAEAVLHASAGAAIAATAAGGRGHLPTQEDLTTLLATGHPGRYQANN
jgi:sugar/nucleoside kinase (ribokinase family)